MNKLFGNYTSFTPYKPWSFTNFVYQVVQSKQNNGIDTMPSNTSSLDMRYVFEIVRFFGWTPLKQHRASPLSSYFFLNVKNELIHPAPSRAAALDQAIYDCIFCAKRSNICPAGTTGRVLSYNLVERLRLCDGACKARFAVRGRTLKLFTAGAVKSLHGSFDFHWGEKAFTNFSFAVANRKPNQSLMRWGAIIPLLCWGRSFARKTFALECAAHC